MRQGFPQLACLFGSLTLRFFTGLAHRDDNGGYRNEEQNETCCNHKESASGCTLHKHPSPWCKCRAHKTAGHLSPNKPIWALCWRSVAFLDPAALLSKLAPLFPSLAPRSLYLGPFLDFVFEPHEPLSHLIAILSIRRSKQVE